MQVLKFGGTSVANATNINKVIDIVKNALKKGDAIVVVSALGGTTDKLIEASDRQLRVMKNIKKPCRPLRSATWIQ